ncbi:MAG: hypothetical protein AB7L70_15785 [Pyrinomonadaceae bacterium]
MGLEMRLNQRASWLIWGLVILIVIVVFGGVFVEQLTDRNYYDEVPPDLVFDTGVEFSFDGLLYKVEGSSLGIGRSASGFESGVSLIVRVRVRNPTDEARNIGFFQIEKKRDEAEDKLVLSGDTRIISLRFMNYSHDNYFCHPQMALLSKDRQKGRVIVQLRPIPKDERLCRWIQ